MIVDRGHSLDPVAEAEQAAAELDWSFEDAELTMQLRAVHQGRGRLLAAIATSMLAIVAGIICVL